VVQKQGAATHPGSGESRFAPGVSAAYNDDFVVAVLIHEEDYTT
jgi:hypothetical protein